MPAKQLKTAGLAFPFVFVDVVRTVIGVRFKDGIVLASENIVVSKLHEPNATKHLFTVDAKLGVVCNSSRYFFSLTLQAVAGLIADGRMVNSARISFCLQSSVIFIAVFLIKTVD